MEYIIEKNLDADLLINDINYFFTFLCDRFEPAVELWKTALEKNFKKRFEPIWVLSSKQNSFYKKNNYIVLNKKSQSLQDKFLNQPVIHLEDYEDINIEFSESKVILGLIDQLLEKQQKVFILPFTSSFLQIKKSGVIILGPNPAIATLYDNKIAQIDLFKELDLPRNETRVYTSLEEVKQNEQYPFYISAAYTSGGHESGAIYTEEDFLKFQAGLRSFNKLNKFLVARLIRDIVLSPNVSAIVLDEDCTEVICITDQILRQNQYLGNIYPSLTSKKVKSLIIQVAKKIGKYLSKRGFRGLFGLDFIVDSEGELYTVDLNPRRQGGYLCNVLMSNKVSLVDIELSLALGEKPLAVLYEDFQVDYSWAHSKIKPYYDFLTITKSFRLGEPRDPFVQKGKDFRTIFYPENALLSSGNAGHIIVSGNTPNEVRHHIIKETEKIISTCFTLYESLPIQ